jgi:rod shape-determining protein MreB
MGIFNFNLNFIQRLGIDLGTSNIRFYLPKRGIVVNDPAVVAVAHDDNKIVAMGSEAKEMLGKTPEIISAQHPLKEGVIANYRVTEAMIRHYINQLLGHVRFFGLEVMIAVPVGITSTERRAVIDAAQAAGAKTVHLIKQPIAAALGAEIPIAEASGSMIIDIGGGTTEVAVISLGDIVASTSARIGGVHFDEAISAYIRRKHNLNVGQQTAEELKVKIGSAISSEEDKLMEITGSNAITGLPEIMEIHSYEITEAIRDELKEVINAVKLVLSKTPPELASDVIDKGIAMTGGGCQLSNLDKLLTKITGVPCYLAEQAQLCTALGTGIAIEHLDEYKRSVTIGK